MRACLIAVNYQNGPSHAKDGKTDFLGEFLSSLSCVDLDQHDLWFVQDGQDAEAARTAKPFLPQMRESWFSTDNMGLNYWRRRLLQESLVVGYDIAVLLDCDITTKPEVRTQGCPITAICDYFKQGPSEVGVVGPVQLHPDGWIWAMGDRTFHPAGYHHVGMRQWPRQFYEPIEVDSVMGCFLAVDLQMVYHSIKLDKFFPDHGRGMEEEWQFRIRQAGWKVHAVPHVQFTHWHQFRKPRTGNKWDDPSHLQESLAYFKEKTGFDRLNPCLEDFNWHFGGTEVARPVTLWSPKSGNGSLSLWTAPDGVVHKVVDHPADSLSAVVGKAG